MQSVSLILIHWIVIYLVDSIIYRFNNYGEKSVWETKLLLYYPLDIYLSLVVVSFYSGHDKVR